MCVCASACVCVYVCTRGSNWHAFKSDNSLRFYGSKGPDLRMWAQILYSTERESERESETERFARARAREREFIHPSHATPL